MIIFNLITCAILASSCFAVELIIRNAGEEKLQIGIQNRNGSEHLHNGGFALKGNSEIIVKAPKDWDGKIWAATGCNKDFSCVTGGCNQAKCGEKNGSPPVTTIEIKFGGGRRKDTYDISLVDGFNVDASIKPIKGRGRCPSLGCRDLNDNCPEELKMIFLGEPVGCLSSCAFTGNDQDCCRGDYNTSKTCIPENWRVNSASYFKKRCPRAYSYAFDKSKGRSTCKAFTYLITFA